MPAQENIPITATVLGLIGTVFWCVQLLPQIWTNWRTKSTEGLPAAMMLIWAISGIPFGVYAIVQNFNIPIQVQPQIFMTLSMCSWGQCLHYGAGWRRWTAGLLAGGLLALFGGLEAALILAVRPVYRNGDGKDYPVLIVGVTAAVLLAAGLVPPYFEIVKRHGRVVGINFVFLAIDWTGAFFSLMSIVAQHTFDELAGVMYIVCIVLETGIFVSHLIWMWRFRWAKKGEELEEEKEPQQEPQQQGQGDLEKGTGVEGITRTDASM